MENEEAGETKALMVQMAHMESVAKKESQAFNQSQERMPSTARAQRKYHSVTIHSSNTWIFFQPFIRYGYSSDEVIHAAFYWSVSLVR